MESGVTRCLPKLLQEISHLETPMGRTKRSKTLKPVRALCTRPCLSTCSRLKMSQGRKMARKRS